jgi:hypothetical protein
MVMLAPMVAAVAHGGRAVERQAVVDVQVVVAVHRQVAIERHAVERAVIRK